MMSLDMNYDTILYTFLIACGINNASTTYFSHILVVGYNALAQKLAQVDDYKSIFEKAHLDKGCTLRLESGWLSLSYTII